MSISTFTSASIGTWTFSPLVTSFPTSVLPNVQFWNVSNGTWEYQIEIAYPLNWTSTVDPSTVDTFYVLDGNALEMTGTEAFRRRRPVEFNMGDCIVVGVGYPDLIDDSPYSVQREYDYQPPVCANCTLPAIPGVPSNAENFIEFLDTVLRPWVRGTIFPNADFNRDALYGHSFGGLFVLYALIARPDLFDTFLTASPALFWNNGSILNELSPIQTAPMPGNKTAPAFQISFGHLEEFPIRRRTETEADFEFRESILVPQQIVTNGYALYNSLKNATRLRNVTVHEYPFSYHSAVAAVALCDGIDYFLDW